MAVLINGDGYSPVTAQQDADFFAGIFGTGLRVLNIGGNLAASIVSAVCVRITDGEAIIQGRRIHVDAGTYDDFDIPAGEQGVTKYYVIGYELYRDVDTDEKCRTFVQEVTDETSTVAAGGVIRDGATSIKAALYRIQKVGVNIGEITALFESPRTLNEPYPVGAIYLSTTSQNPSKYFGGTWEEITGKFLLGRSASHAAGSTGGAETKTLAVSNLPSHRHAGPSHTHTISAHTHTTPNHTHTASTASAGGHKHAIYRWLAGAAGTARWLIQGSDDTVDTATAGAHTHAVTVNSGGAGTTGSAGGGSTGASGTGNTGATGGGEAISIMPPFITVYMWKRTA